MLLSGVERTSCLSAYPHTNFVPCAKIAKGIKAAAVTNFLITFKASFYQHGADRCYSSFGSESAAGFRVSWHFEQESGVWRN